MLNKYGQSLFILFLVGCSDKNPVNQDTNAELEDTAPAELGPEIWSGTPLTFEKLDDADPEDPVNQDAITELVVLTRGNRGSLYNVVVDSAATSSTPTGTEWAKGNTIELDNLEFETLKSAADNQMRDIPGVPLVLHLIEEDIYIDLVFLSWSSGGSDGGFSYERSTPN